MLMAVMVVVLAATPSPTRVPDVAPQLLVSTSACMVACAEPAKPGEACLRCCLPPDKDGVIRPWTPSKPTPALGAMLPSVDVDPTCETARSKPRPPCRRFISRAAWTEEQCAASAACMESYREDCPDECGEVVALHLCEPCARDGKIEWPEKTTCRGQLGSNVHECISNVKLRREVEALRRDIRQLRDELPARQE